MLENKMNDEIKRAGLEALVTEEVEEHLILNSNRLRTFEDARREVVTYVERQFGFFKFVIPSRVTRVCVNTQRLERSTLSCQSKEKGHPFLLMKRTTTGVWMNGMVKGVVLDGMKTTNGCAAQLQPHFHLKAQKE